MKPGGEGPEERTGAGAPAEVNGREPGRRGAWQSPPSRGDGIPPKPSARPGGNKEKLPLESLAERGASPAPARSSGPAKTSPARKTAAAGPRSQAAPVASAGGDRSVRAVGRAASQLSEPTPPSGFRPRTGPRGPALTSRGERILFWTLLFSVLAMSIFLVRYRERVDAHFQARAMAVPLLGAASPGGTLVLSLANDATGALTQRALNYPVPEDPGTRARVALEKLLSEYTAPGSLHPLQPIPSGMESVQEVFLTPVPGRRGLLAVVDLPSGFVRLHPSGIEPETLTLLSMIATLHANLPSVTEVHFLVDGEPRATLAGHADLSRTYLAGAAPMTPSEAFTTRSGQP